MSGQLPGRPCQTAPSLPAVRQLIVVLQVIWSNCHALVLKTPLKESRNHRRSTRKGRPGPGGVAQALREGVGLSASASRTRCRRGQGADAGLKQRDGSLKPEPFLTEKPVLTARGESRVLKGHDFSRAEDAEK